MSIAPTDDMVHAGARRDVMVRRSLHITPPAHAPVATDGSLAAVRTGA